MKELVALAPGRIQCTGPVDTPRLRKLVRGAAALVFPSSYEGCFGLPPLEAMAAGVPVIAADIPPVREVCGAHINYFPADSITDIENVLRQPPLPLAQDTMPLRQQAAKFTWDKA